MRLVGLTGGIACGKSTVSRELRRRGVSVVDADALAHATTKRGAWGYRRVVRAFGREHVLDPTTGEIDRDALARLVFSDPAARRRLNAATHPPVALALALALLRRWLLLTPLVVVDMPLLFETGSDRFTSATIVVSADLDTQLKRLASRDGMGEEQARQRIGAQMSAAERERRATVVLRNQGGLADLEARVGALVGAAGPLQPAWGWAVATWPPVLALGGWALGRVVGLAAAAAAAAAAAGARRR
jgi:dephospho-CoA kinase